MFVQLTLQLNCYEEHDYTEISVTISIISLRYIIFKRLRHSNNGGCHERPQELCQKPNIITSMMFRAGVS